MVRRIRMVQGAEGVEDVVITLICTHTHTLSLTHTPTYPHFNIHNWKIAVTSVISYSYVSVLVLRS